MSINQKEIKPTFRHSLKLLILCIVVGFVLTFSVLFTSYILYQFNNLFIHTVYHEALLLSDTIESGVLPYISNSDTKSLQRYIDNLLELREIDDIEINVLRLISEKKSEIVASNNKGNIEPTDEEEHTALIQALKKVAPVLQIEKNIFDIDPDDDITTYSDPEHPDYYLPPGYRIISITTPLRVHGKDWGSINIQLSLAHLDRRLDQVYLYIGMSLCVGLLILTTCLVFLLKNKVFNPLWDLAKAIYDFGLGQLPEPPPIENRKDEISVLKNEFINMVQRITEAESMNKKYREHLEDLVDERTKELTLTQEATILSMASLAETRDPETGGHIKRTQNYIKILATHLQSHPKYSESLTDENVDLIYKSAPLHDIGKVGVPDYILLKPEKLSPAEFETMKLHTVHGRDALLAAEEKLGSNSFLRFAREIAYTHQEKWDGSGYPQGLKGEEIPVSGRLMAVADVYDALISRRVYKPPFSHNKAMCIIKQGKGSHFDPDMVDAFLMLESKIKLIAYDLADSDDERNTLGLPYEP
ncbi:HD domain-containing phosphohydrolase [Desulfobacter latus]|nr:HD domain-containing phosphohydrolase [Desulfobacter latus]